MLPVAERIRKTAPVEVFFSLQNGKSGKPVSAAAGFCKGISIFPREVSGRLPDFLSGIKNTIVVFE
jgi:hypothetical protein